MLRCVFCSVMLRCVFCRVMLRCVFCHVMFRCEFCRVMFRCVLPCNDSLCACPRFCPSACKQAICPVVPFSLSLLAV